MLLHIRTDNLHVDGRGQAEVQDLGDDVGRLKEELHARETLRQHFAQLLRCSRRWAVVLGIERDQNLRVAAAYGPAELYD